jgi:hypothetical protein
MTTILDDLTIHSSVIIRPIPENCNESWVNKNFRYDGVVKNICMNYINRGAKHFGKEKVVYISFVDIEAYNNLLLKGSKVMCYIYGNLLNCYITSIIKDGSSNINYLEVAIYDDEDIYRKNPILYTIDINKIDSMLITDNGYLIKKL